MDDVVAMLAKISINHETSTNALKDNTSYVFLVYDPAIKDALVKKENGVNPFLTVMNFRITFRAWSKAARRRIQKAERARALKEGELEQDTLDEAEDRTNLIAVEIDVENIYSATSEEDEPQDPDGRPGLSRSKSGYAGAFSASGSQGSGSERGSSRRKKAKSKDHLERFQRKMTAKFQESIVIHRMQSSTKKGVRFDPDGLEGRTLKSSILRSITKRQRAMNDLNSSAKSKNKSGTAEKK